MTTWTLTPVDDFREWEFSDYDKNYQRCKEEVQLNFLRSLLRAGWEYTQDQAEFLLERVIHILGHYLSAREYRTKPPHVGQRIECWAGFCLETISQNEDGSWKVELTVQPIPEDGVSRILSHYLKEV